VATALRDLRASGCPALIVVDDLHWVPPRSTRSRRSLPGWRTSRPW
jgi:hypothetical protein